MRFCRSVTTAGMTPRRLNGMRFKMLAAILLVCAASGFAQEHMADALRAGIVAEDSKQDTRAAIQQYNAVLKEYAAARETAATALFRMAECYRKMGVRQGAIAAYQRVVQDFSDQTKLVARARAVLAKNYQVTELQGKASAATRILYRQSIVNQINIAKSQLATAQQRYNAGVVGIMEVNEFKAKIADLETQLAGYDAGLRSARSK